MLEISEVLARAIQAGDCVLWFGAGLGAVAGRPTWGPLLARLIDHCPEDTRPWLRQLLDRKQLDTVMTHVLRWLGDKAVKAELALVAQNEPASPPTSLQGLTKLPFRACFVSAHADIAAALFGSEDKPSRVFSTSAIPTHFLGRGRFFVLRTRPTAQTFRSNEAMFDLVEEIVRTRTILLAGFEPGDPDLGQVLDLIGAAGPAGHHFAVIPGLSVPEAKAWRKLYGVEVVPAAPDTSLSAMTNALVQACAGVDVGPSDVQGELVELDLIRAVSRTDPRADLACDGALTLDAVRVELLIDRLGSTLHRLPPLTLLRAGSVMLTHGKVERARRCFEQAAALGGGHASLVRFNVSLTILSEGDRTVATKGLRAAAEGDRQLALVPDRFELRRAHSRSGSQMFLTCFDRKRLTEVDLAVCTLPRPVGNDEGAGFTVAVRQLARVDHPAVCKAREGFADGRLFGVVYAATSGAETLAHELVSHRGPLPQERVWKIVLAILDGLAACHAKHVIHRNINPANVILSGSTVKLWGFGFPPVIGFTRPSVRMENHGYMAPEVFAGQRESPASDVYSVGALTYRLLTGRSPLGSVPAIDAQTVDPRLDALLRRVLHPLPSRRPSAIEFSESVREVLDTPGAASEVAVRREPRELSSPAVATWSSESSAKLSLPDNRDDLDAWATILARRASHVEARQNIDRIEADARVDGRWDRVVEVLGVKAKLAQVQDERVDQLREMVEIFEDHLDAPANAFASLQTLIDEVDIGEQVELLQELERLAQVTGQWTELTDSMLAVTKRVRRSDAQASLYVRLGEIFSERLHAPHKALEAYQAAIRRSPSAEAWAATLPLHRNAGNDAELASALLSLADLQSGEERHGSLLEAARVLRDDLSDSVGALGTIEIVLGEVPDHRDALSLGEAIARSSAQWDRLVDILNRRADLSDDPVRAQALRREASAVAAEHLEDSPEAIALLDKILEADPGDRDAAERQVELLRRRVQEEPLRRTTLIDAIERLLDLAETTEERAELLGELAGLLDDEPDGRPRARERREQVLELLPADHDLAKAAAEVLERAYRRVEDFPALEDLFEYQTRSLDSEESFRAAAWKKLLDLREGPLFRESGIVEALEHLARLEPQEPRYRDELARRYLDRDDFQRAEAILETQIGSADDPARKAALLLQSGRLHAKQDRVEAAITAIEAAVRLDDTSGQAWLELSRLYARTDQPLKSVDALVVAAAYESKRNEKMSMLFEAASAFAGPLADPERAIPLLEEIVEVDADHAGATELLVGLLVDREELEQAWPHAQRFMTHLRAQPAANPKQRQRALMMAARCAMAAGESEQAKTYATQAKELAPSDLALTRLIADLDLAAGRWADAVRNYQTLIVGLGKKVTPSDAAWIHLQVAKARAGMGDGVKALQMVERALAIDPHHDGALEQLVLLSQERGPAAVVRAKEQRLSSLRRREDATNDVEEIAGLQGQQVTLHEEIAGHYLNELKDSGRAIAALEQVLTLRPDDPAVLHRLLDVFTKQESWPQAIGVLERLAEQQSNSEVKAKYLYAGAVILRDNLKELENASEWMRRVLDADPEHKRAFDALLDLLMRRTAWTELSRAIRNRLKSHSKSLPPDRLVELFEMLAEAHRNVDEDKTALAALEQAVRAAEATDEPIERRLQRRYEVLRTAITLGDDYLDKAARQAHAIIADVPSEFEAYHRLVEAYLAQGARDRARAVARTLKFLHQANAAEAELAAAQPGQVRDSVQPERWRQAVMHWAEDHAVSDVLAIVWPMLAALENRGYAMHGIRREDRIDVSVQSPIAIARYLAYACGILDVAAPDLYLREANGLVIDALADTTDGQAVMRPSILLHRDEYADQSELGFKFRAGQITARARPEHLLAAVWPSTARIRDAVHGALRLVHPAHPLPPDLGNTADACAAAIRPYLAETRFDEVRSLVEPLRTADLDTRSWLQGVVYTCNRAGLIMSDSLETSAQLASRDRDESSGLSSKDRVADLVAYSVSEIYLALREDLGLSR